MYLLHGLLAEVSLSNLSCQSVTFEKEADQRHVLASLSVGSVKAARNDVRAVKDAGHLFRGERVLDIHEAEEVSEIRHSLACTDCICKTLY